MATIKYDVSDVESGGGGEEPQPGLYNGFIAGITHRTKKAGGDPVNDLEVVVDIGQNYVRLWTYIPLNKDATNRFKLREFTDALGLPEKGSLPELKTLIKKKVGVKVRAGTHRDTGDYRGEIKNLLQPLSDDALTIPADGNTDAAEGEVSDNNYEEWEDNELKEELTARDLKVAGRWTRDKAIEALVEFDGPGADDGDDAAEGDSGEDPLADLDAAVLEELKDDADYYTDWEDDDIKQFLTDLGLTDVKTAGRGWRVRAVGAIVELAQSGGGGANGDAPEAEADAPEEGDTYDDAAEWPDVDLKAEISERNEQGAGIKVAGRMTRDKMIAALREDDKAATGDPF